MKSCGCTGPCTPRCRNDRAAMARVARILREPPQITPIDAWVPASARPLKNLKPSALKVLGRLQAGPATNADLAQLVGFRYSARIHEFRSHGHEITCEALGPTRGIRTYSLEIK